LISVVHLLLDTIVVPVQKGWIFTVHLVKHAKHLIFIEYFILKSIIAAAKTFFFANIANESGEVENLLFPIVVYILNVANHDSQQRVELW